MKAHRFGAIVLYTSRIDAAVRFYRAAGLPVEEERHEDEVAHFACEIGDIHFAIFEADGRGTSSPRTSGSTMLDLQVASVIDALNAVKATGTIVVLGEPEDVPWGKRVIVLDPDGREVQLHQSS